MKVSTYAVRGYARSALRSVALQRFAGCALLLAIYAIICLWLGPPWNQTLGLLLVLAAFLATRWGWRAGAVVAAAGLLFFVVLAEEPRFSFHVDGGRAKVDLLLRACVLALIVFVEEKRRRTPEALLEKQKRSLKEALRLAVDLKQFALHYQPIVDSRTGSTVAMEALLRWTDPEYAGFTPDVFLPLVDDLGLSDELSRWVLLSACSAASAWPEHISVHVNVSPRRVVPELLNEVKECLAQTGLPPKRLTLEVVETFLLKGMDETNEALKELRRLGVCIALDDFGVGFSSLHYLLQFPVEKVKLDRAFVKDLLNNPRSQIVVRGVSSMAKAIGISVTAEGVETESQMQWLRREGINLIQGYLISKPVPEEVAGRFF